MGELPEPEVAPRRGFAGGGGRILPGKSPDARGAEGHARRGIRRGRRSQLVEGIEGRSHKKPSGGLTVCCEP